MSCMEATFINSFALNNPSLLVSALRVNDLLPMSRRSGMLVQSMTWFIPQQAIRLHAVPSHAVR
jgi:predicted phosphatase